MKKQNEAMRIDREDQEETLYITRHHFWSAHEHLRIEGIIDEDKTDLKIWIIQNRICEEEEKKIKLVDLKQIEYLYENLKSILNYVNK